MIFVLTFHWPFLLVKGTFVFLPFTLHVPITTHQVSVQCIISKLHRPWVVLAYQFNYCPCPPTSPQLAQVSHNPHAFDICFAHKDGTFNCEYPKHQI